MKGKVAISIQMFHPIFTTDKIKKYFDMTPDIEYCVNTPWILPNGKIINALHKRSYLCYDILPFQERDLEDAIDYINEYFEKKIKNKKFLKLFIQTGGTINYYIGLGINNYYAFELCPEILRRCKALNITLGIEIYNDLKS